MAEIMAIMTRKYSAIEAALFRARLRQQTRDLKERSRFHEER